MKYLILFILLSISFCVIAGDLDDGIQADEAINDDLRLDTNIQFITQRAKSAQQSAKDGKKTSGKIIVNDPCGTGNQNFGAGANLKGATIVNLSNNKGTTVVCGQ